MMVARCFGVGALFLVATTAARADIIEVAFDFTLNNINGGGLFTYDTTQTDPSHTASDAPTGGDFADANDGLLSFDVNYNGNVYQMGDSTDFPVLPVVLLPGNKKQSPPGGSGYQFIALIQIAGTCTDSASFTCNPEGTFLAFGQKNGVQLISGVSVGAISFSDSTSKWNVGSAPDLQIVNGTIGGENVVPEPGYLSVSALGIAGLWFARRRARA
jgi:hypothetical protein